MNVTTFTRKLQYCIVWLHCWVAVLLWVFFCLVCRPAWKKKSEELQYFCLYSPTSIIRTRDAEKMQGQSTHCDHVTWLRIHSKPMLRSCHTRTSCCIAIKSSSNAQSKRNASVLSIEDEIEMLDKSVIYKFLHAWRFCGCGLGVDNVIRIFCSSEWFEISPWAKGFG